MGGRDVLSILGSGTSICAGVALVFDVPTGWRIALGLALIVGIVILIAQVLVSRAGLARIGRSAMVSTGDRLIREVKGMAVLFGSDMSWAGDYREAIKSATTNGKRVVVVHKTDTAKQVMENEGLLREAGADIITTPIDLGLRAILVDPKDSRDALLFVALRQLKKKASKVAETGERGTESSYEYVGKVYDRRRDRVLIDAVTKMYELLG